MTIKHQRVCCTINFVVRSCRTRRQDGMSQMKLHFTPESVISKCVLTSDLKKLFCRSGKVKASRPSAVPGRVTNRLDNATRSVKPSRSERTQAENTNTSRDGTISTSITEPAICHPRISFPGRTAWVRRPSVVASDPDLTGTHSTPAQQPTQSFPSQNQGSLKDVSAIQELPVK